MGKAVSSEERAMREIVDALATLQIDDDDPIVPRLLPAIREYVGLECIVYTLPVPRVTGWRLEFLHHDNVENPAKLRRLANTYLETAPMRFGWFDPQRIEPAQRNVAIDVTAHVTRAEYEDSAAYKTVIAPSGYGQHELVRLLVCQDSTLLGWIGGFTGRTDAATAVRLFNTIASALQRRMWLERRLQDSTRISAALATALDQVGAPAIVVSRMGRVHELNTAARELVAQQREGVASSLEALFAHRRPALPFSLTRLPEHECYLAILRPRTAGARIAFAVAIASHRWKLTPRQQEVLGLLVNGESNAAIAKALGVTNRAAELHISAIMDRAQVDNRAGLVASVLLG